MNKSKKELLEMARYIQSEDSDENLNKMNKTQLRNFIIRNFDDRQKAKLKKTQKEKVHNQTKKIISKKKFKEVRLKPPVKKLVDKTKPKPKRKRAIKSLSESLVDRYVKIALINREHLKEFQDALEKELNKIKGIEKIDLLEHYYAIAQILDDIEEDRLTSLSNKERLAIARKSARSSKVVDVIRHPDYDEIEETVEDVRIPIKVKHVRFADTEDDYEQFIKDEEDLKNREEERAKLAKETAKLLEEKKLTEEKKKELIEVRENLKKMRERHDEERKALEEERKEFEKIKAKPKPKPKAKPKPKPKPQIPPKPKKVKPQIPPKPKKFLDLIEEPEFSQMFEEEEDKPAESFIFFTRGTATGKKKKRTRAGRPTEAQKRAGERISLISKRKAQLVRQGLSKKDAQAQATADMRKGLLKFK